jgi:sugar phosphate isomerase/epimerase
MRNVSRRARRCAVAASAAMLMAAPAASAQRPASVGDGVPTGQLGVQMFNYGGYLNNGANTGAANPITGVSAECATSTTAECRTQRLEGLFAFLQRKGLTNIELFAHSGFPAQNDIAGLKAYRALLDKYGLHAGGWHGTVTDVGPAWTERVAAAKILGADYIGSGGTASPGIGSYADTLATAAALNRLGKESVEGGVGPVYIHNHTGEFDAKYVDGGTLKSAWQILMDRTDPRYVNAEVDAFWSSDAFNDVTGTQTAALINANPTRVRLLHIKDGINVAGQPSPTNSRSGSPRATGTGEVDFRPIFAAAKNRVQYMHQEHDGGTITDADVSFTNLKGVGTSVVPTVLGLPTTVAATAAGTTGATTPVTIQNTGDAPLTITGASITGDNAANFTVVGHNCATLATRATCAVNVAFKPTSTNTTSVAYLTIASNADAATESILLTARSTGDAAGGVGGTVPATLSLNLGNPVAFGAFTPGVARTYLASTTATVTSTAGDATLSVADTSTTAPGHLVNGAFSLPQPLQARARNAANTGTAFNNVNSLLNLLTYDGPVSGDAVTLEFSQRIEANDALRTGQYSKTLTYTLSTTTP